MVPADNNDVAVAVAGAVPGLLESLEPVYAALYFGQGAPVSEVARMDEEVAWWEEFGGDLVVSVGDADTAYGGAVSGRWRWSVRGATEIQQEVVQESDEGGDGVLEEGFEKGGWGKDRGRSTKEGHFQ